MNSTPEERTLITVRAEAQRTVAPDEATLAAQITTLHGTKRAAEQTARDLLTRVTADLAANGGTALTPETARVPLCWSVQSLRTEQEVEYEPKTGRRIPTGRQRAMYSFAVFVRDFTLLGRVEQLLVRHDGVSVHGVGWSVDDDNPAWALTRAEAVREALRRGQHYASALGGSVRGVAQISDAGMLSEHNAEPMAMRAAALAAPEPYDRDESSLDPVPQVLAATIDAQLLASIPVPE
jgi:uncharacterized protein YggE